MFISKFWTLLLALTTGILLAVILLAKDLVNRERVENATAILYKEMTKADVALKLHARKRLDVLLSIAVDPSVRKYFYSAAGGGEKEKKVRSQLLNVLRKRNKALDKYKADLLLAVNLKGDVICQVGGTERRHGYNLAGFPAVDAARRGYVRDDVWKLGNDVFLIATRPVIDQGRYLGVLVHAMKMTDKLASDLSRSTQLAFFAENMMVAVGTPDKQAGPKAQGAVIAKPLDQVLASEHMKKNGYSEIQEIVTDEQGYMAVYSGIRGEAAANNVGFALITAVERMSGAAEFYEKAGSQDVSALPTVWLVILVLVAAGFGWGINYLEGQRPATVLLKQLKVLEQSDPKDQLNVYKFRSKIRKIAIAMNTIVDYKIRSLLDTPDAASKGKNISDILGSHDPSRLSSAAFKFSEATASDIPPPPPVDGANPAGPGAVPPGPPPAVAVSPQVAAAPQPPTNGGGAVSPEQEMVEFRGIYEDFVSLKKRLGESVDQLTFDRFLVTLKKNRDTLQARYSCQQVKFKVYEKDGKASLKATPVK